MPKIFTAVGFLGTSSSILHVLYAFISCPFIAKTTDWLMHCSLIQLGDMQIS